MRPNAEDCPSKDVLSAYYDGELLAAWRARVEDHLQRCSACRDGLLEFSRLREALVAEDEPHFVDAMARTRNVLALQGRGAPPRPRLWYRRVSVPVPIAALAAAAVFLFGLGMFASLSRRPSSTVRFTAAPTGHTQFEIEGDPEDVSRLLQALNHESPNRIVTFDIPADIQLVRMGEPALRPALDARQP